MTPSVAISGIQPAGSLYSTTWVHSPASLFHPVLHIPERSRTQKIFYLTHNYRCSLQDVSGDWFLLELAQPSWVSSSPYTQAHSALPWHSFLLVGGCSPRLWPSVVAPLSFFLAGFYLMIWLLWWSKKCCYKWQQHPCESSTWKAEAWSRWWRLMFRQWVAGWPGQHGKGISQRRQNKQISRKIMDRSVKKFSVCSVFQLLRWSCDFQTS